MHDAFSVVDAHASVFRNQACCSGARGLGVCCKKVVVGCQCFSSQFVRMWEIQDGNDSEQRMEPDVGTLLRIMRAVQHSNDACKKRVWTQTKGDTESRPW